MKVQMSLNDELVKRVDKYAADNYLTRSATVSIALSQFLSAHELTAFVRDISLAMRKIADTGVVDDDVMRKLEDFDRMAKLLSGGTN